MIKQTTTSSSNRRITSEKYYDCFQCAEQCRHLSLKNNYNYTNNKNSYNNNSNNTNNTNKNTIKNTYTKNNKNSKNTNKNYNSSFNSKNYKNYNNTNNNNNTNTKNYNSNKSYKNKNSKINITDTKKIINDKCYFTKNEKKNEKICLKQKVLKTITNQQILNSKQFTKTEITNNKNSSSDYRSSSMLNNHFSNYQTIKKRSSSLARPMRVYDSFTPPKWMMMSNDSQIEEKKEGFKETTATFHQHLENNIEHDFEDLEPNSNCAFIDAQDEDANWPIRLRLEELLEQSKKKKRKGIVTIRKSKIIKSEQGKNSFKDTERLLKVLSNHVDQDSRYNIKRCCVM
ncbi:putative uncharacterized protein DDB_G0282499 [Leptopilina boulardi]|uniref:putative uncharacterized protein DDB_G0282499 n=1 Tax=Leptopilina boulardi TaxID=63433 RepID=UPI0021F66DE2|nr:putative uncharacterized protein DDB_G0282499 [Leptopilina boulardi]